MAIEQSAPLRWIARLLRWAIRGYQLVLSPFLGGSCRFAPSCSVFAEQALQHWPLHQAVWRISYRLARCHPWHPGGPEPVQPSLQNSSDK